MTSNEKMPFSWKFHFYAGEFHFHSIQYKGKREKVALQTESHSVLPILNIFIVLLRGDWMKQHSTGHRLTITLRIMLMDKTSETRGEKFYESFSFLNLK